MQVRDSAPAVLLAVWLTDMRVLLSFAATVGYALSVDWWLLLLVGFSSADQSTLSPFVEKRYIPLLPDPSTIVLSEPATANRIIAFS